MVYFICLLTCLNWCRLSGARKNFVLNVTFCVVYLGIMNEVHVYASYIVFLWESDDA